MNTKKWAAVLVTLIATLVLCREASAQSAAAEALFDEGRRLMGTKNYAEACDKFERSQQIDASVGTLLNLGDCLEKMNRMASAWTRYKEAGNLAAKLSDPRGKTAAERAAAVQPRVSRLTITVAAAAKVDGLEVSLDGQKVAPALIGVPSPIDAGAHVVSATAPGKKAWKQDIKIGDAEGKAVEIPVLGADDGSAPAASETPAGAAAGAAGESAAGEASEPATGPSDQGPQKKKKSSAKTFALIAGGIGVVGIGVGTFLALGAKSKYDDAKSHCKDGTSGCDAEAASMSKDAKSQANLATVGFGVGIAGLAAGAVLWFTAPKETAADARPRRRVAVAPLISRHVSGLVVEGILP